MDISNITRSISKDLSTFIFPSDRLGVITNIFFVSVLVIYLVVNKLLSNRFFHADPAQLTSAEAMRIRCIIEEQKWVDASNALEGKNNSELLHRLIFNYANTTGFSGACAVIQKAPENSRADLYRDLARLALVVKPDKVQWILQEAIAFELSKVDGMTQNENTSQEKIQCLLDLTEKYWKFHLPSNSDKDLHGLVEELSDPITKDRLQLLIQLRCKLQAQQQEACSWSESLIALSKKLSDSSHLESVVQKEQKKIEVLKDLLKTIKDSTVLEKFSPENWEEFINKIPPQWPDKVIVDISKFIGKAFETAQVLPQNNSNELLNKCNLHLSILKYNLKVEIQPNENYCLQLIHAIFTCRSMKAIDKIYLLVEFSQYITERKEDIHQKIIALISEYKIDEDSLFDKIKHLSFFIAFINKNDTSGSTSNYSRLKNSLDAVLKSKLFSNLDPRKQIDIYLQISCLPLIKSAVQKYLRESLKLASQLPLATPPPKPLPLPQSSPFPPNVVESKFQVLRKIYVCCADKDLSTADKCLQAMEQLAKEVPSIVEKIEFESELAKLDRSNPHFDTASRLIESDEFKKLDRRKQVSLIEKLVEVSELLGQRNSSQKLLLKAFDIAKTIPDPKTDVNNQDKFKIYIHLAKKFHNTDLGITEIISEISKIKYNSAEKKINAMCEAAKQIYVFMKEIDPTSQCLKPIFCTINDSIEDQFEAHSILIPLSIDLDCYDSYEFKQFIEKNGENKPIEVKSLVRIVLTSLAHKANNSKKKENSVLFDQLSKNFESLFQRYYKFIAILNPIQKVETYKVFIETMSIFPELQKKSPNPFTHCFHYYRDALSLVPSGKEKKNLLQDFAEITFNLGQKIDTTALCAEITACDMQINKKNELITAAAYFGLMSLAKIFTSTGKSSYQKFRYAVVCSIIWKGTDAFLNTIYK